MEAQYFANNVRELELTKHFSLALMQPIALVQLLQTGTCTISLDEPLFDSDHPGLYFRRLRSVAVTIPCVTGPYTGVNATLSLGSSVVRTVPPSAGFQPWIWATSASNSDPGISAASAVSATPIIATSSGQNDAGMFDVNLRDERWLPFEGQGAVSQMILTLDPRDNNFDISSVTDVVLHVNYTARAGGDAEAVRRALKPQSARSILVSTRNTFGDAYYSFFNPTDTTATQQALTLPLTDAIFPFSNLGTPSIADVTIIVVLVEPMSAALVSALGSGPSISGTFDLTNAANPAATVLRPVTGTASGGGPVAALSSGDITLAAPTAPTSFTLTIPESSLSSLPALQTSVNRQARLDPGQISDIVLLIGYNIG
jgi:Tc toxin complex TcA C-terminal TcB-binding domain